METYFNYLLQTNLALALLAILFIVFLRKAPFFQLNRWIILGLVAISLIFPVLPKITLPYSTIPKVNTAINYVGQQFELPELQSNATTQSLVESEKPVLRNVETQNRFTFSWTNLIEVLYGLGVFFMFITLCIQFFSTLKITQSSREILWEGGKVYVNDNQVANFSFFNKIYLNKQWENLPYEEKLMVYQHEQEHVKQMHSFDILFLELIKLLFWFNPAVWILKRTLQMQHEYLVDSTINKNYDKAKYAELLLQLAIQPQKQLVVTNSISTFFNLKNRCIMMTKTKSLTSIWRYPLFLLLFAMSCTVNEEVNAPVTYVYLKYIESEYINHSSDSKEGGTVATVYLNQDGSIQKLVKHREFPFDKKIEEEKFLWVTPNVNNIPLMMDGFTMGSTINNFLYGNAWSKIPAEKQKNMKSQLVYNSPDSLKDLLSKLNFDVEYKDGLPVKYISNLSLGRDKFNRIRFTKNFKVFEYENEKVSVSWDEIDSKIYNKEEFVYERNKLIEAYSNEGKVVRKFYYEQDQLAKSEFYINQQLEHHREYLYKDDGKIEKTLMYNSNGELEYTINHNYIYATAD